MKEINKITSPKNTQIKLLRKLALKKYRRQYQQFTVENLAIIMDALKSGHDFMELFVTQNFIDKHSKKFEYIQERSSKESCYLVSEALNKSYSQLDTSSGITAIYAIKTKLLDNNRSVIYFNGIKDPGNIGTIMRTALAFDVSNVVLDVGCVDIYNFKSVHAAKDAIFKINVLEDEDGTWLQRQKGVMPIYVANSDQGEHLSGVDYQKKFCLVLGNEAHGVSESIVQCADKNIHIEVSNQMESLNVASAASILLYGLRKDGYSSRK